MGRIQERKRKDGKPSFTAQVRRKKGGKTVLGITGTFDKKAQAKARIERKERELSQPASEPTTPSRGPARPAENHADEAPYPTRTGSSCGSGRGQARSGPAR